MRPRQAAAFAVFFTFIFGLGCSSPTAVEEPPPVREDAGFWVMGYHPYWLQNAWESYDFSVLGKIMFFDVTVKADGSLDARNGWPQAWQPLAKRARQARTAVVPTVTILDTGTFVDLFGNPVATQALRRHLVTLVQETPVEGLHLDFEVFDPVGGYVRRAFTSFVRDLRKDLEAVQPGLYLSVFTLASDHNDAYDEGGLAEHVDYLVVQGYDLHWAGGTVAGPVAPLTGWGQNNWTAIVERYLALGVPRKKIIMSVPYYGYEWPTTTEAVGAATRGGGTITSYAPAAVGPSARDRARTHGLRRDLASGSPYYAYQDSTGWRQGWFEDAVSLQAKYAFIREQQLGGVAIFPLGYGDPELEAILRASFGTGAPPGARRSPGPAL